MVENKFIADNISNTILNVGTYDLRLGIMVLPNDATLPVGVANQILFVPSSGILAIHDGISWKTIGQEIAAVSGFNPSDPLVSGGLLWWGEPSGINLDGDSASGITSWTGRTPSIIGAALAAGGGNVPTIISGFLNGYRTAYFGGAGNFIHGGMNLTGADNDFTVFAVCTPQAISGGGDSAIFAVGRSTSVFALHLFDFRDVPGSGIRVFRRDDANTSVDYREGGQVVLGETHIYTMAFSGTQVATFIDGLQVSSSGMNVGTLTINTGAIGSVSSNGVNSSFFVGEITELIVFNSGCGLEAQQGIHSYLSSKYGISLRVGY